MVFSSVMDEIIQYSLLQRLLSEDFKLFISDYWYISTESLNTMSEPESGLAAHTDISS